MKKYRPLFVLFVLVVTSGVVMGVFNWRTGLISFAASFMALLLILLLNLLTKPQLLVEVDKDTEKKAECFETGHHTYRRVIVKADTLAHRLPAWLNLTFLAKHFMAIQPALRCEGKLIFLKENGCPQFYDNRGKIAVVQGRWARTAEPRYGPSVRFLFSVGLAAQADLEQGALSQGLLEEFKGHHASLPREVTVSTDVKGSRWRIKAADRAYIVIQEGERLNICSEHSANEHTNTIPWVDKMSFVRYVDIPCGSSHELDVVMRRKNAEMWKQDRKQSHAWHNSYIPVRQMRMQNALEAEVSKVVNFDLEEGQHLVLIEVRAGGELFSKIVSIMNTENEFFLNDFSPSPSQMTLGKLPKPEKVWDELVESAKVQSNNPQNKRDKEEKEIIDRVIQERSKQNTQKPEHVIKKEVIRAYLDVRKALWENPTADEVVHDPFRIKYTD
ncbi:MAG: hypothetical protein DDT35_01362 [Firmicutes bacterium]|nr:hypothetical protein [Bacillota bacterium]